MCQPHNKFCDLLLCSMFHRMLTMLTPREKDFSVIMRHMEALLEHGLSHPGIFHMSHHIVLGSSLPSCHIADNLGDWFIAVTSFFLHSFLGNSILFLLPCITFPPHTLNYGKVSLVMSRYLCSLCSICIGPNHHGCIGSSVDRRRSSYSCICLSLTYSDWSISLVIPL